MCISLKVPPHNFGWVEVWTFTGHCNILILFLFQSLCWRFCWCAYIVPGVHVKLSCWEDGLTFVTLHVYRGIHDCQMHRFGGLSTTRQTFDTRSLCWYAAFCLQCEFTFVCPKDIALEFLWLVQMPTCNRGELGNDLIRLFQSLLTSPHPIFEIWPHVVEPCWLIWFNLCVNCWLAAGGTKKQEEGRLQIE